jgi:hypothetical protein
VVLTIHWRGGRHSVVRVGKPETGEHGRRTSAQAVAVVQRMAGKWSDQDIAATLNRMGIPTGHGNTWNAVRIAAMRSHRGIRAYDPAREDATTVTMSQAASHLGVTNHVIRHLIKSGLLPASPVVPRAPYQIPKAALDAADVLAAVAACKAGSNFPCRASSLDQNPLFPDT